MNNQDDDPDEIEDKKCGWCGGTRYWVNGANMLVCIVCHPPAAQALRGKWPPLTEPE